MTRTQIRNLRFALLGLMIGNIVFIAHALAGMLISFVLISAYLLIDIRLNPYASLQQIRMNKILLAIYGVYALVNIAGTLMGYTIPAVISLGILAAAVVVIVIFSRR